MVYIGKVYTRTGDTGSTSLADGSRVPKDDARLAAYGDVDELNATLGVARELVSPALGEAIAIIQNDLFDLGADLATPLVEDEEPGAALRMVSSQVERLETEIDGMNDALPPLDSFILPGGTLAGAELHRARTICRRAERVTVALAHQCEVSPDALRYLNRLSDWLFVAARKECVDAGLEVKWIPAANR